MGLVWSIQSAVTYCIWYVVFCTPWIMELRGDVCVLPPSFFCVYVSFSGFSFTCFLSYTLLWHVFLSYAFPMPFFLPIFLSAPSMKPFSSFVCIYITLWNRFRQSFFVILSNFFSCFKHKKRLNGKMQNAFLLSLFYKTTSYSKSNTHPPPCPWYCGVDVLFSAWRMAFLLTGTSSSMRAFITKNRGVQRECPFGAGPQANFMMRGTPAHLAQSSTGLRTNVVSEDILYRIPDISLDNICSSNGIDSMAVSKPSMSKPSPMFFVQYKQYLAPL